MRVNEDRFPTIAGETLENAAPTNSGHWVERVLSEDPAERVSDYSLWQLL